MTERSFSDQAFIHSKLRNRLGLEKVQDLTFIRENAKILDAAKPFCDTDSEDEIEGDDDDDDDDDEIILD